MDQGETVVLNSTGIQQNSNRSPWGKTPVVAPCSLSSVIDEEMARDLQQEEQDLASQHHLAVDLPVAGKNYKLIFLLLTVLQDEFFLLTNVMLKIYSKSIYLKILFQLNIFLLTLMICCWF